MNHGGSFEGRGAISHSGFHRRYGRAMGVKLGAWGPWYLLRLGVHVGR
jgi:hypothetical protein